MLTFTGPVLTAPVTIAGEPVVHLNASTSGTDSDWVVKLIDVYPDEVPSDRRWAAINSPIAMDIFRGRYRESPRRRQAARRRTRRCAYSFALPTTNHVFLPGHRIMVQVQSSWFPLYDRNPQTFVPNIFFAKPADYVARAAAGGRGRARRKASSTCRWCVSQATKAPRMVSGSGDERLGAHRAYPLLECRLIQQLAVGGGTCGGLRA